MTKLRVGISLNQDLKDRLATQALKEGEGFTATSLLAKIVSLYVKKRNKRRKK